MVIRTTPPVSVGLILPESIKVVEGSGASGLLPETDVGLVPDIRAEDVGLGLLGGSGLGLG